MDLLKKNIISLICGVIGLLAIGALFWPVMGYYQQLREKGEARRSVYSELKSITDKTRQMPLVDLHSTEPKPLEVFPRKDVIEKGQAVTDQVKAESAKMLEEAIRLNQHQPLVFGALPQGSAIQLNRFRSAYNRVMDFMNDENRSDSFPVRIMQAGFPPNEAQVQLERAKLEREIRNKTIYGPNNQPINNTQIDAELAEKLPKVAQQLKEEAAQKCKVYIDATALDVHQAVMQAAPGVAPEPSAVYQAQVGLWIQQDVAGAIASANSDATNVMESPVKHVLSIAIPDDLFRQVAMSPEGVAAPAGGGNLTTPATPNFSVSPTGRVSNGAYDVYPFVVRLRVDAEQIPRVLQEFSRNRFITVTNCNLVTSDPVIEQAAAAGFYYGKKPVVELELTCEELLLRKWTEPLMPLGIKQSLGLVAMPGAMPME